MLLSAMSAARPYVHTSPAEFIRNPFVYPTPFTPCQGQRIIVEVGPGRGDFLFHLARTNPQAKVVGIEIKRKRTDKLIRRIERFGFTNICLIQDDARQALPRFFPDGTVDEIHFNFPDPWPKNRHAKKRAVNQAFLEECARVLKPGGTISIATDHEPYASDIAQSASRVAGLISCYPEVIEVNTPQAFPTFFALKWRDQGRRITYQKYKRAD